MHLRVMTEIAEIVIINMVPKCVTLQSLHLAMIIPAPIAVVIQELGTCKSFQLVRTLFNCDAIRSPLN